jgi:hypothetical protein
MPLSSVMGSSDCRQFVECFRTIEREHPYAPVEGCLETIHWFRRQQIPMALCTTNDRQTLAFRLHSAGIDPKWFAAASTWESGHPKPDPRALDPIFAAVPVLREHAVYVGDWYPDVDVPLHLPPHCRARLHETIPRRSCGASPCLPMRCGSVSDRVRCPDEM